MGAAGAAWAVLIAEAGVLSTIIPWQTARISGGSAIRMISLTYGFTAIAFAISTGCAWVSIRVLQGDTLITLTLAGIGWAILVAGPLFLILLNSPQRGWVIEQIKQRVFRSHP